MPTRTAKPKKLDDGVLALHAESWDSARLNGYSDRDFESKALTHRQTVATLKHFARTIMGLRDDQYEVSSNQAGVAVPGDVSLYVDKIGTHGCGLFLQIGGSIPGLTLLYRTSEGRQGKRFDCGAGTQHRNNNGVCKGAFDSVANMTAFYRTRIVPLLGL